MDHSDIMAEVDAQISKILNKKSTTTQTPQKEKENNFCDASNLPNCLEQLSQEFDYLDVNALKNPDLTTKKGLKTTLIQLVNSSYNLLKLQQETQKKYEINCDKNTSNQSEIVYLRKINESLRKELKTKDGQIKLQNERKYLEKMQSDEVNAKLQNARKEIALLKKDQQIFQNRHKHEISKYQTENKKIEERFRKNCTISSQIVLEEFSLNEKKHRKTIEKLQMNNHELLEEIVALREEIKCKN